MRKTFSRNFFPVLAFQLACERPIRPRQQQNNRWCNLAILPPLQTPNKTSSYFLYDLKIMSSSHVHNLARCSIFWRARTPKTRF